jgi:hypothetical protein
LTELKGEMVILVFLNEQVESFLLNTDAMTAIRAFPIGVGYAA